MKKVKTTPVAHQICRRRFQLYASFKNIGADGLNDLLEGAKVWQKDWIRQIRADLEEHGLKTKCDQILKRLLSSKGRNQFNVLMKTVVECFIAKKKKRCTDISEIIIQNPRSRLPLVKYKLIKEMKELQLIQELKELYRSHSNPATGGQKW